jgi:flagellar basal body rod protein FlgG
MPYGLYISAEGALAQSTRMETISNNLANADTPGFKRDLAIFQSRYAEEIQRGNELPGSGTLNDLGGGVDTLGTFTDFSPGVRKNTYEPTDLAIEGPGFFVVRREGQDMLTRAGNFAVMPEGNLVTQAGDPVIAADGTPVVINPREGAWHINPSGTLIQGGTQIPLALVQPRSLGDLVKVGENMFSPLSPPTAIDPTQRRVLSGCLEGSTVKAVSEMTEMIETSRVFEANVNMIRNQDQILSELVSRVLHTA